MPKRRETTLADVLDFVDQSHAAVRKALLDLLKARVKADAAAKREPAPKSSPKAALRGRRPQASAVESEPPLPHLAGFPAGSSASRTSAE